MPQSTARMLPISFVAATAVFSLLNGLLYGQSSPTWGAKLLEVTEVDFGTVPQGSNPATRLKIKNVFKEEIELVSFISSGTFSWADALLPTRIPSGKEVFVELRADTIRFAGERKSKVRINMRVPDHDASTTVELPARIHIRSDLVLSPDGESFGVVELGKGAERKMQLAYVGDENWQLTTVKCDNPHMEVTFQEMKREKGTATYEVTANVKPDAPKGKFESRIVFSTKEEENSKFSILVTGDVRPEIMVWDINLGPIKPGQTVTRIAVVQSRTPIQIENLTRTSRERSRLAEEAVQFKLDKSRESTVHTFLVTFTAPNSPGQFEEKYLMKFVDRENEVPFLLHGTISDSSDN